MDRMVWSFSLFALCLCLRMYEWTVISFAFVYACNALSEFLRFNFFLSRIYHQYMRQWRPWPWILDLRIEIGKKNLIKAKWSNMISWFSRTAIHKWFFSALFFLLYNKQIIYSILCMLFKTLYNRQFALQFTLAQWKHFMKIRDWNN